MISYLLRRALVRAKVHARRNPRSEPVFEFGFLYTNYLFGEGIKNFIKEKK